MSDIGFYITALFVLAWACQWVAWRTHMPAILYLIIVGFSIGPISGWFKPDDIFGDLLLPMTSLGVAVILFEGSLTLRFQEIKNFRRIILHLCSIGVLVTWGGMSLAAKLFTPLGWAESLLFGALVAVTGPTVIAPMLRSMKPNSRIANILRWEGIVVDPLGAMLALLVLVYLESHSQVDNALIEVLKAFGFGITFGLVGGWLMAQVIRRHWVPEYLMNLTTLAIVLSIFSISNNLVHESGLIAVTVMGIFMANQRDVVVEQILHFKEHLSVIIISMLFLILSARIELQAILSILVGGLLVLACAQFIVRPLAVWVSGIGSSVTKNEKLLLSWVAPRGIVAAAISAVFAERLAHHGYAGADSLVPLTFMIIIGTVVIQSATAKQLALKLGLSDAESQGVLITGANRVSIAIAEALMKQGIPVRMADDNWSNVRDARMKDIPVYYGNPLSESAEFDLDLGGLTKLLSLSPNPEYNTLVSANFKPVFEPTNIFTIATGDTEEQMSKKHQYNLLFDGDATWQKVSSLLSKGWEVRATNISESYTEADLRESVNNKAILLGGISPKEKLRFTSTHSPLTLDDGWTGLFLMPPKNIDEVNEVKKAVRKERSEKVEKAAARAQADNDIGTDADKNSDKDTDVKPDDSNKT